MGAPALTCAPEAPSSLEANCHLQAAPASGAHWGVTHRPPEQHLLLSAVSIIVPCGAEAGSCPAVQELLHVCQHWDACCSMLQHVV